MFLWGKARKIVRHWLMDSHVAFLRRVQGHDIGRGCIISFQAKLDKTNPRGVHIGEYTGIALGATILSHNFTMNRWEDTWIGSRCMIGANALIGPGVRIGDGCIIGPGAVVLTNIPDGSVAIGNPARVVERGIRTGHWGIRLDKLPPHRIDAKVVPADWSGSSE